MLLEERTILTTAIREWGPEKQTMKAAEELCELAAALMHLRCLLGVGAADKEIHTAWDHVVEEIADAGIMLDQMRMLYDDTDENRIRAGKLRRLAARLGLIEPAKPEA